MLSVSHALINLREVGSEVKSQQRPRYCVCAIPMLTNRIYQTLPIFAQPGAGSSDRQARQAPSSAARPSCGRHVDLCTADVGPPCRLTGRRRIQRYTRTGHARRRASPTLPGSTGPAPRSARPLLLQCGSVYCGSARDVSVQYGSARYGSVQFGSDYLGSARYGSVRPWSVHYGSTRSGSL